jgi:Fe2+ transport system protein B
LSVVLKLVVATLVAVAIAVVVDGFMTGTVASSLVFVALVAGCIGQWATIRRESDEAKSVADRMFIAVFTLLAWIARPALHSIGALISG